MDPAHEIERAVPGLVIPGWDARVDRFRNLIVERRPARAG